MYFLALCFRAFSPCVLVDVPGVGAAGLVYSGGRLLSRWIPKVTNTHPEYRGAGKPLARPTSGCILFDGENISFDTSLVLYKYSTNIPPIMIINRYMNIKIFCRCSLFPSWSG